MLRFKTINTLFAVLLVVLLVLHYFYVLPVGFVFVLVLGWLLITVMGSAFIRWNYHFNSLHHSKATEENHIAITFDDGPHPVYTPKVLRLLTEYNAKATFFCIGKNIEAYPELFNQIINHGHTVGNHTYSHSNGFGFFSTKKVEEELRRTNAIAEKVSGKRLKMYRPAFGVTNPNIKKALQVLRLTPIGWSKRSFDTTQLSEKKLVARVTHNLKKGDIILLHDTSDKTIAVLERLLLFLKSKNMQAVTVNQLLSIQPYE